WIPVLGVGLFSISPKERYLLHIHLIGYILLAAAIIWTSMRGGVVDHRGLERHRAVRSVVLGGIVVGLLTIGLVWRISDPVVHADHVAATEYVAAHRQDGDLVIAALPAVSGLIIDDADDLYFLAGTENRSRAERLTRVTPDGLVDYWMGVRAIVSAEALERLLRDHPGAWVIVDEDRLGADWAYEGAIAETLDTWTEPVYEAAGGALVLRVPPAEAANGSITAP
ncbi:MAG: hypothetical protein ACR2LS_00545, partial [Thermomicrobiales bacterium]